MIRDKVISTIEESSNIVFFGGAGVSTESGIPDFRSADGIYNSSDSLIPPEEILSHTFFMKHPHEFYVFYYHHMIFEDAKPGVTHLALARLEQRGKLRAVITQNIDGLHQKAGSRNVIELHGTVNSNYCMRCGRFYPLSYIVSFKGDVPVCEDDGDIIKPKVVLYEEGLDQDDIMRSVQYISEADTLIVGGTSLNVYPAAGLIRYFGGKHLILINRDETPYDHLAEYVIHDDLSSVFGEFLK